MRKVKVEHIVFLDGADYDQLCQDLDPEYDPEGAIAAWLDEDKVIEYLFQWYYPGEHSIDEFNADDINTEFLGYEREVDGENYLFSHNTRFGYAGISRIVEFIEE